MSSDRGARLYGDDELRVLWLSSGRREAALSADGVWLRTRRRTAELQWAELDQVQCTPVGLLPSRSAQARLDVFTVDGSVYAVGPFPRPLAERWVRACAHAASEHGERVLSLEGAAGFALARTAAPEGDECSQEALSPDSGTLPPTENFTL